MEWPRDEEQKSNQTPSIVPKCVLPVFAAASNTLNIIQQCSNLTQMPNLCPQKAYDNTLGYSVFGTVEQLRQSVQ